MLPVTPCPKGNFDSCSWATDKPKGGQEMLLKLLEMFIATWLGNIERYAVGQDSSGRLFNEKIEEVRQWITAKAFPNDLKEQILQYYHFKYSQSKYFDEDHIFDELNEPLCQKISLLERELLIKSVPFLKDADRHFINQLVTKMKLKHFLTGDVVIDEGSSGEEMFFIASGSVEVITGGQVRATLDTGLFFGEIALVLGRMKRTATIRTQKPCRLYSLSRSDLENVLASYPVMQEKMIHVAKERLDALAKMKAK